jgi:hypothetical protein
VTRFAPVAGVAAQNSGFQAINLPAFFNFFCAGAGAKTVIKEQWEVTV